MGREAVFSLAQPQIESNVYVALSDIGRVKIPNTDNTEADPKRGGGIWALRLSDGQQTWMTPPPGCGDRARCEPCSVDRCERDSRRGVLRRARRTPARMLDDQRRHPVGFRYGRHAHQTVNGVPARGGSIDGEALRSPAGWCSRPRATTTAGHAWQRAARVLGGWEIARVQGFKGSKFVARLPDARDEAFGSSHVGPVLVAEFVEHHLLFWSQSQGEDQSHRHTVSWVLPIQFGSTSTWPAE